MAILNSEEKDTIVSEQWASHLMANQIIKMTADTPPLQVWHFDELTHPLDDEVRKIAERHEYSYVIIKITPEDPLIGYCNAADLENWRNSP